MSLFTAYFLWFLIGFAFIVAELSVFPAFVLIFFALGAWVTSAVAYFWDLSLTWQIILFIVSSLAGLGLLRRWGMRTFKGRVDDPAADGLEDESRGHRAEVVEDIGQASPGAIRYRGSQWAAVSDREIKAGSQVIILGRLTSDRTTYRVKPV